MRLEKAKGWGGGCGLMRHTDAERWGLSRTPLDQIAREGGCLQSPACHLLLFPSLARDPNAGL